MLHFRHLCMGVVLSIWVILGQSATAEIHVVVVRVLRVSLFCGVSRKPDSEIYGCLP